MGSPIWVGSGPDNILVDGFVVFRFLDHFKGRDRDQKSLQIRWRGDWRASSTFAGTRARKPTIILGMSFPLRSGTVCA